MRAFFSRAGRIALGLLGLLAAGLLIARNLIGVGEDRQRAKSQRAQREAERAAREALDDEHRQTLAENERHRAARDRGDFRHFNDDEL